MLTFVTSTVDLHEQLVAVLSGNGIDYSIDTANTISIGGPYWGDAYDLVAEFIYDPVFGRYCVLACDDDLDTADLRQELIAKGIPFIEECVKGEHGFVLSAAKSPI